VLVRAYLPVHIPVVQKIKKRKKNSTRVPRLIHKAILNYQKIRVRLKLIKISYKKKQKGKAKTR
jgi:flagellar motor component MotA